jgi:hypothetical protein
VEKTFIVLIVIAVVLKMIPVVGAGAMLTIAVCGLALLYMCFSFALFNGVGFRQVFRKVSYQYVRPIQIVSGVVAGFSIAMMLTGVLFKLQC